MPLSIILGSVALGGAVGAATRYLASEWIHARTGLAFPWGTLVVNLVGCFLLGLAYGAMESTEVPEAFRPALTVGFLGAFTTFSTFSWEGLSLLQKGQGGRAALYLIGSVAAGLLLVAVGLSAGRMVTGVR